MPTAKLPATGIDHGDNFFIVSQRPGQNISYEPQAMMGYPLKENSKVDVVIDNKTFVMFTKDKAAWVENAAQEPALVAALQVRPFAEGDRDLEERAPVPPTPTR